MVRFSVQPFPICQIHFNPFLYLQPTQAGPRLVPLSTELVRKAAFELALPMPFQHRRLPLSYLGQFHASIARGPTSVLVLTGLLARLGFPHPMHARYHHEVIDATAMHINRAFLGPNRNVYESDWLASSDIFC